jgi:hypothetical protein
MTPQILTCPHCGAPLAITRFASIVICSYCEATVRVDPSAVSASRYRQAWAEWNTPEASGDALRFTVADTHWVAHRLLARGEIADVYVASRARWPSELAVLKVVRDDADAPLLEQEWRVLGQLHAKNVGVRVPAPVAIGDSKCVYRWAGGFVHTFEAVRAAYPDGVPPVASIWVWRRILEVLTVMRKEGLVHGAILPNHLLVQTGEHGVRLVGFSCADRAGAALRTISTDFETFYPASVLDSQKLTAAMDIVMSARCVTYLLGRRELPPALADLLHRVGNDEHSNLDPWKLHHEVGELGRQLFGPPAFHPIAMT